MGRGVGGIRWSIERRGWGWVVCGWLYWEIVPRTALPGDDTQRACRMQRSDLRVKTLQLRYHNRHKRIFGYEVLELG